MSGFPSTRHVQIGPGARGLAEARLARSFGFRRPAYRIGHRYAGCGLHDHGGRGDGKSASTAEPPTRAPRVRNARPNGAPR
jgi:hypothetical protein